MKKTMIYLPEELHKNLKRLAVERESSLADVIREAALALLEEDRDDLAVARQRFSEIRDNPSLLADFDSYRRKRASR